MRKRYSNPNRIYKHSRYLEGRDLHREKVRVRDNHTCQDCGVKWEQGKRRFDIHHLNGLCGKKSKGYDYVSDIAGLITLCHKCHFNRPEHKSKQVGFRDMSFREIKDGYCKICEMKLDSKSHINNPCK